MQIISHHLAYFDEPVLVDLVPKMLDESIHKFGPFEDISVTSRHRDSMHTDPLILVTFQLLVKDLDAYKDSETCSGLSELLRTGELGGLVAYERFKVDSYIDHPVFP